MKTTPRTASAAGKKNPWKRAGECLYIYGPSGVYYARKRVRGKLKSKSLKTTDRALANRRLRDWGNEQERIDPAAGIKVRKREDPIRETPTPEQFRAIVSAVRHQRRAEHAEDTADLIEFMGLCGGGQPRSLRRMFCTDALNRAVGIKAVSAWQGHTDGGALLLRTYSHVIDAHAQREAAKLVGDDDRPGDAHSVPQVRDWAQDMPRR
ncbi:MAG TPA: hypothetical protein PLU30_06115 [Verrucomicrobiae bacterium]|nr:hypothetical protein [Verrucomicrobiae bacterium]